MYRTLITFILFTIGLALPPLALQISGDKHWLLPQFWAIFIMLTMLTFILMGAVFLVQKRHPEMYAQAFLLMTVIKMLFSMVFALVFILKIKVDPVVFVLNFFYVYFLNTIFEVLVLLRNLRNQI